MINRQRIQKVVSVVLTTLAVLLSLVACPVYAKLNYQALQTPDGLRYVLVSGEFELNDDLSEFASLVGSHGPTLIGFNSGGGNVVKAMELGRMIRSLGLHTIQFRGPECSSACALSFIGGVKRFAEPGSIGVHKSSFSRKHQIDTETAVSAVQHLTAEVISYMIQMGVDPALLQLSLRYESDDIRYLSKSEMQRYKVITLTADKEIRSRTTQPGLIPPSENGSSSPRKSKLSSAVASKREALEFIHRYHAAWSGTNQSALNFMNRAYSNNVRFYGRPTSKSAIILEKKKFSRRWPIRNFSIRTGSERISCDGRVCNVKALVDWYAHSKQREKTVEGVAEFQITFDLRQRAIVSESGKVLRAKRY